MAQGIRVAFFFLSVSSFLFIAGPLEADDPATIAFHPRQDAPSKAETGDPPETVCEWSGGFHLSDLSHDAYASVVFDDGTGPQLYFAGEFLTADGRPARHIARWDGESWHALGEGTEHPIYALAVYDDGDGEALYAAGSPAVAYPESGFVAKWDGSRWSPVGTSDGAMRALAVYDGGDGPELYAGGHFSDVDGTTARRVAKWDGTQWTAPKTEAHTGAVFVESLLVHDDGSGPALYVGGYFFQIGDIEVAHIAKWDGTNWSPLGLGLTRTVEAMAVYDDGSGPALYVGGRFTGAGNQTVNHVARWDGSAWHALETGVDGWVNALGVHDDGSGPALYVGGYFTHVGTEERRSIARWDGAWHEAGSNMYDSPHTFVEHDLGDGPELFVAGTFTLAGEANHVARWDGGTWRGLNDASGAGVSYRIYDLLAFDDGTGPALYAGGRFFTAGGQTVYSIARWRDAQWTPFGNGVDNSVKALAAFRAGDGDGDSPRLFIGGDFTSVDGLVTDGIAQWTGSEWARLGLGLEGSVQAMATFDDGDGEALYVGGKFTVLGETEASHIARWTGGTWSAVGPSLDGRVNALAVYDDGTGPALYAGGDFDTIGGATIRNIAKWDGTSWTSLGSGVTNAVSTLAVYDDDGEGAALYVGGFFDVAGGGFVDGIAKWDGASWSAVGSISNARFEELAVYDDGSGPALYAGGVFTYDLEPESRSHLARWNGEEWTFFHSGPNDRVDALAVYDDGISSSLYAGGWFRQAGGKPSSYVGRYACVSPPSLRLPSLGEVAEGERVDVPIFLDHGGRALASTAFSVDYDESCLDPDVDGDGELDLAQIHAPADFEVTIDFDPLDPGGEIDVTVTEPSTPITALPSGSLLTLSFQSTCSPTAEEPFHDAEIRFSVDPGASFGTDLGESVEGLVTHGAVRIWSGGSGFLFADGFESGDTSRWGADR